MKLKNFIFAAAALVSSNVYAMDYTSVFADNGNKVTETRTFTDGSVQTWEWLDLTVTNGVNVFNLFNDLSDGAIDDPNLQPNPFNPGATSDLAALSAADRNGWQIQSTQQVSDLLNQFFGVPAQPTIAGPALFADAQLPLVGNFLAWFGDTATEGAADVGAPPSAFGPAALTGIAAIDPTNIPVAGFTESVVSPAVVGATPAFYLNGVPSANATGDNPAVGTFLARNVTAVSEPGAFALFALALSGLVARRRRAN